MTGHVDILPGNATEWARLFAETRDPIRALGSRYQDVRIANDLTPPQFLPWLIWQYGLGELTPYVPTLNQLIDEGVQWQRVRGTPSAIYQGLSWIGYAGTIEEAAARRRRWNRFQLYLSRVRDNDLPDLARIDGIVSLSPPIRSKFSRGFRGYDIRAAETSYQRTSASLTSDHSGVYLPGIGAKWSFGRLYERDITLTQADLEPLGAWIAPVPEGDLWVNATYLWSSSAFLWSQPAALSRRAGIAALMLNQAPFYIRFKDAAGEVIGNARAVAHAVKLAGDGAYLVAGSRYAVDPLLPDALIVAARTGFGDGAGRVATSMCIVVGATPPSGAAPGARWLAPASSRLNGGTIPSASMAALRTGISGGREIASVSVNIPFGLTVRERPIYVLRF
jgi:hypothetical protein